MWNFVKCLYTCFYLYSFCFSKTTEEKRLEELFPALDGDKGGCAWFQEDMSSFLHEMYSTCHKFLQVCHFTV
jgi:hypothetical protein